MPAWLNNHLGGLHSWQWGYYAGKEQRCFWNVVTFNWKHWRLLQRCMQQTCITALHRNNFSAQSSTPPPLPPSTKKIPIIIRHLLLSRSTTERTADVKAFGPIKVCDMPPFPLPPAPATLITDVLVCLWARRSLASLITNLETSHLLYLFFFFFPLLSFSSAEEISHICACNPERRHKRD